MMRSSMLGRYIASAKFRYLFERNRLTARQGCVQGIVPDEDLFGSDVRDVERQRNRCVRQIDGLHRGVKVEQPISLGNLKQPLAELAEHHVSLGAVVLLARTPGCGPGRHRNRFPGPDSSPDCAAGPGDPGRGGADRSPSCERSLGQAPGASRGSARTDSADWRRNFSGARGRQSPGRMPRLARIIPRLKTSVSGSWWPTWCSHVT